MELLYKQFKKGNRHIVQTFSCCGGNDGFHCYFCPSITQCYIHSDVVGSTDLQVRQCAHCVSDPGGNNRCRVREADSISR